MNTLKDGLREWYDEKYAGKEEEADLNREVAEFCAALRDFPECVPIVASAFAGALSSPDSVVPQR